MARHSATSTLAWFRLGAACCVLVSSLLFGATTSVSAGRPGHIATTRAAAGIARTTRCRLRNSAAGSITIGVLNPEGFPNRALSDTSFMRVDDMFRHDDHGRYLPLMATEVPTLKNGGIKNGGRTIIIHLKRGLHWSNGAEFTSSDVRFGWRTFDSPAFDPVNNCGDLCTAIDGITTPDRYTAVIRLKRVDTQWLNETEGGGFWAPTVWPGYWNNDPHAAVLKYLDPSFGPSAPSNGPYRVESFDNSGAVMRPMKYYTDLSCGGFINRITVRVYRSPAALIAAASSRTVDIWPGNVPGLLFLPQLRSAARAHAFKVHDDPGFFFEHLELNHDSTYRGQPNPLHDARVRLALALAVRKLSLIQRALGVSQKTARKLVAWSPWKNPQNLARARNGGTTTGQWDPIAHRYVADTGGSAALADARKLLAATPWKHGLTLEFVTSDNPARRSEAAAMGQDWARIGVHLDAHFVPQASFTAGYDSGGILSRGAFQIATLNFSAGGDPGGQYPSLESGYSPWDNADHSGINYSGIRDPLIDRAFTRAESSFSHTVQRTAYGLVQSEVNRKAHWIPLYFVPQIWTEDGRVAGLSWNPSLGTALWNPSALRLKTGARP